MARTKGATNKAKFIHVSMEELSSLFQPKAVIMVSAEYAGILGKTVERNSPEENDDEEVSSPISFTINPQD